MHCTVSLLVPDCLSILKIRKIRKTVSKSQHLKIIKTTCTHGHLNLTPNALPGNLDQSGTGQINLSQVLLNKYESRAWHALPCPSNYFPQLTLRWKDRAPALYCRTPSNQNVTCTTFNLNCKNGHMPACNNCWRQNTESGLIDIYKTLIIWNVKQRLILTMPKYESRFPFAPSTY